MGERVGVNVHACIHETTRYIYALAMIVLVMPYNCGFVFLSSHFVRALSGVCQVFFFWVSAISRQKTDSEDV